MDKKIFNPSYANLKQSFSSREQLLHFAAQQLAEQTGANCHDIEQGLIDREAKGSTAVGEGIAIPHCNLAAVDSFALTIITLNRAIEYGAFDHKACQLFFCLVGPQNDRNTHVQILSTLTVGLSKPHAVEQLLACSDGPAFVDLLLHLMEIPDDRSGGLPPASPTTDQPRPAASPTDAPALLRLELFCQQERHFHSLLEELTAVAISAPAVVEAENSSAYLHQVPLFASIWGDERPQKFLRVLVGVIKVADYGKLLRRVKELTDQRGDDGVLMLSSHVAACYGALNY